MPAVRSRRPCRNRAAPRMPQQGSVPHARNLAAPRRPWHSLRFVRSCHRKRVKTARSVSFARCGNARKVSRDGVNIPEQGVSRALPSRAEISSPKWVAEPYKTHRPCSFGAFRMARARKTRGLCIPRSPASSRAALPATRSPHETALAWIKCQIRCLSAPGPRAAQADMIYW